MANNTWLLLFLSLALGLLVGLQRESANSRIAGIRTFPLITLFGSVCGLLALQFDTWILAVGLLAVTAIAIMGNIQRSKTDDTGPGITTEVAVLLMYGIGAFVVMGDLAVPVVLTGVITVLLHFKTTLHGWVDRIGERELLSIMQFVLISMVILPVLPDTTYDRFQSLNPRDIWLMVVLITGISLAGYFLYKILGEKAGTLLGGILGGLISSTATTISYAKRSGGSGIPGKLGAFVILTASAVSMVRVLVEISIVAPASFKTFAWPLIAELACMILLVIGLFFFNRKEKNKMPEQSNPAQIKAALVFALLYAAISFISAVVKEKFGGQGLYAVSVISGLTDLDAITLSTSKMAEHNVIDPSLAWRLILVAVMSNLVFKAAVVMFFGNRNMARPVAILFGILILAGCVLIFAWPP